MSSSIECGDGKGWLNLNRPGRGWKCSTLAVTEEQFVNKNKIVFMTFSINPLWQQSVMWLAGQAGVVGGKSTKTTRMTFGYNCPWTLLLLLLLSGAEYERMLFCEFPAPWPSIILIVILCSVIIWCVHSGRTRVDESNWLLICPFNLISCVIGRPLKGGFMMNLLWVNLWSRRIV